MRLGRSSGDGLDDVSGVHDVDGEDVDIEEIDGEDDDVEDLDGEDGVGRHVDAVEDDGNTSPAILILMSF